MFILYLMIVTIGFYLAKRTDPYYAISYNPAVIFLAANLLYTAAGKFSLADDVQSQEYVFDFLSVQIVGVLGIIAPALIKIKRINSFKALVFNKYEKIKKHRRSFLGNMALGLVLICLLVFLNIRFGGLYSVFTEGYSLMIDRPGVDAANVMFDDLVFIYVFPALLLALGYLQNFNKPWIFISALFILVLVLLGSRNPIVMYAGAAIVLISVQNKCRVNYLHASLIGIFLIPFLLITGFVRNFGLQAIIDNPRLLTDVDLLSLIFKGGEFFTTINVFIIHLARPEWWDGFAGESYLNAIFSTLPKLFWPSRPDPISHVFSRLFAPPGEGLGFSVNLEALVNFGFFGVFLVNFIISFFWMVVYFFANHPNRIGYGFLYSNIFFVALNMNRIDFQTIFKMSLIQFIFSLVAFIFFRYLIFFKTTRHESLKAPR